MAFGNKLTVTKGNLLLLVGKLVAFGYKDNLGSTSNFDFRITGANSPLAEDP